jgi:HK97 family phage prohead protease
MSTRHEIGLKGIQLRSAETEEGHTIEGLAVPFDNVIDTFWDGSETFDRDCVFDDVETAKLCYQHDQLIGSITRAETQDDGLHITARIADTTLGRDVIALLDSGALDSLSVGFVPIDSERDKAGITHRKRVRLLETSLVSWPAYEAAKLTNHRSQNQEEKETTTMENETTDVIEQRMSDLEQKQRELAAASVLTHDPAPLGASYRSAGEFLRSLEQGDSDALNTYETLLKRDFTGTVLADTATQTAWVTDMINLVQSRRSVLNIFSHEALPATGESVSYKVLASDTTQVGKQTKEGDTLPFGKVALGTKSANIETYGGYTQLSRQSIERSDTPALTTALNAMALAYAKNTETAARSYLYSQITAQAATENKLTFAKKLSEATAEDWIDIFIDAAEALDDLGAIVGTLGVSKDVFKAIAKLQRDGNSLLDISGLGASTLGTIDLTGTSANLSRVSVQMLPKATDGTVAFIDPTALKIWESSGAPFQLQDQNVLDLTQDFSVYGYMAMGTPWPEGILPLVGTAAGE